MTLTEAVDLFLATKNPETRRLYKRGIDLFLAVVKDTPLSDISDSRFSQFCTVLRKDKTLQATSKHSYAKGVRRLLHYINRNQFANIRTDVLIEIERETLQKPVEKAYELPDGIREFLSKYHSRPAPSEKDEYLRFLMERAFIGVLESTGSRITAVLEMRVKNIRWKTNPVKIKILGKGSREHILRLGSVQAGYLKQWLDKREKFNDFVFPALRGNGRMSDETGRKIIREWMRYFMGDGFDCTPHAFRHLFITYIRDAYGLEMAQALVGHKSIQTTSRYPDTRKEEELDKIYLELY